MSGSVRLRGDVALFAELESELRAAVRSRRKAAGRTRLGGCRAYFKRSPLEGKARWRHAARGVLLRRPVPRLREFDNLVWLREGGFAAPRPLLAGVFSRGGLPSFQFLYTEEIPGARTLREALPSLSAERRSSLLEALARDVARLHARGFVHRDLFPRNLLVSEERESVWFVDAWRGGPSFGLRGPAYDLACLALYGPALLNPTEERTFFEVYFGERERCGERVDAHGLLRSAARNRRSLLARLRGRSSREAPLEPPADWTPPF